MLYNQVDKIAKALPFLILKKFTGKTVTSISDRNMARSPLFERESKGCVSM